MLKKLENTITTSFQSKIGWERPRKKEKKIVLMCFYPTRNRKLKKKKQQRNLKNQKTPSQLLFKTKLVGRCREREKKNRFDVVLADFNRELKKIAKKFKKLENTIVASFQAKIGCERLRKRGKKKIIPMCSYPTRNTKSQKIEKKFKKLENIIIASFQDKI